MHNPLFDYMDYMRNFDSYAMRIEPEKIVSE